MTQPRGRTRSCGADEAWDRYLHAQSFLDTAELVLEDTTREGYANVSPSPFWPGLRSRMPSVVKC
jgi:hypothetical protein